jgi:uncharacterized SAM-binding protein YcdF (DUF218 family)
MEAIAEAVKTHFIPGSTTALIFGLVAGLILWARTKRWAIRWLAFLTAFYWIISTALFAGGFEKILSGNYARVEKSELPSHVEAIVILGGGSETYSAEAGSINAMSDATSLRVLEGARLASILPEAQVIVSGGPELKSGRKIPETEPMMQALGLLGIDQERVSAESQSGNTYEQARYLRPMLEANSVVQFLLVTSPTHMNRALATFRSQGLDPIAAPAALHSSFQGKLPFKILPSSAALTDSRMAFRELFALGYYWVRGWLSPPQ